MTDRQKQAQAFYAARDLRTRQVGADEIALNRPIALSIDADLACSRDGQVAFLALIDMLFRVHRDIRLAAPTATAASGEQLADLAVALAATIDPFQDPLRNPVVHELRVHLNQRPDASTDDVVGSWSGGRGEVHISGRRPTCPPRHPDSREEGLLGAATAACLVAAAVFSLVHDRRPVPTAVNLLSRSCGSTTTEDNILGPVDVGDVDVFGGGAVGHALTYWVSAFGFAGQWSVIDGGQAEIHNANRCMGMTVADAGWPEGIPLGHGLNKAISAARNMPAVPLPVWHHQLASDRSRPDLVLVLANEYGIREEFAQSGLPVLLHATTSPNWTAELHRHVPGRDGCPACRIPSESEVTFTCSQGPSNPDSQESGDASLPFLSATAGLMLSVALLDLRHDHRVLNSHSNHCLVHLELPAGPAIQTATHRGSDCRHHLSARARHDIQGRQPRQWDWVDD